MFLTVNEPLIAKNVRHSWYQSANTSTVSVLFSNNKPASVIIDKNGWNEVELAVLVCSMQCHVGWLHFQQQQSCHTLFTRNTALILSLLPIVSPFSIMC